jgi:hypothetical protein
MPRNSKMRSNGSAEILEINILVQRDILKNNKWSKPVPALKGSSYEVLQMFSRIFFYETQKVIDKSCCFQGIWNITLYLVFTMI